LSGSLTYKLTAREKDTQVTLDFPLTPAFGVHHAVHTFGGSTSLTTLSSTPHFVLRLSVEGRSLRLEESLSKGGIFNQPSPLWGCVIMMS